uniref:Uncharacterized protein n=1 Tax=Eutreptiella gymnastica TaxID=73025 RepID=A0A7S4FQZ5_9EUGL|mmetsp:Transcript_24018/g.38107  ORF Transcript_24018/g.38107 Transcript_24018/m.38107 type:complete len:115 (+) Transcript_24018:169-513(+)
MAVKHSKTPVKHCEALQQESRVIARMALLYPFSTQPQVAANDAAPVRTHHLNTVRFCTLCLWRLPTTPPIPSPASQQPNEALSDNSHRMLEHPQRTPSPTHTMALYLCARARVL